MSAIITDKLRIFNAQQFIESVNEQTALWVTGVSYAEGDVVLHQSNLYVAVSTGTSGATAPTHVSGVTSDGTVDWAFYNKSIFNSLYLGIGRKTAWTDETNPPTPADSLGSKLEAKKDLTALKKVNADTITLSVPRINWTVNTTYDMHNHTVTNPILPNNYVLVEAANQYNVYKCINNKSVPNGGNRVQSVQSTVAPTGTNANGYISTADGYVWKFMYSIKLSSALKYLTNDYFPVAYITSAPADNTSAEYTQWQVQQNALTTAGSIDWVDIVDDVNGDLGGGSYHPTILMTSTAGPTEGATSLTLDITGTSNQTNAANDYTNYALVYTNASNQTYQRKITSHSHSSGANTITIGIDSAFAAGEGGGTGTIKIVPNVVLSDTDGTGFAGHATLTGDIVTGIVVTNGGSGYTYATGAVEGHSGATECKILPIMSPENGHGWNAVEELGGYYAMIALKLEYDEQATRDGVTKSLFPVSGEDAKFRQIVILSDPIDKSTSKLAAQSTYRGPSQTGHATVGEEVFDIEKGSGKVLYIENRQSIARAVDQIEDIKVVFEF